MKVWFCIHYYRFKQTCCDGYKSKDYFPGLPGSGKKYYITYKATDENGFSETCNFQFTVKCKFKQKYVVTYIKCQNMVVS